MKKLMYLGVLTLFVVACSNSNDDKNKSEEPSTTNQSETTDDKPSYDPKRGEGKFTHVDIGEKLDAPLAEQGEETYSVKCSGCHKLTDERLVGPGWQGVTSRHQPEWIMNFVTNTDEMISKDPKVQAQLEICLVRMPNQNLSDDEARGLLEFMRKNDGVQ
jgi:hypothetical protein